MITNTNLLSISNSFSITGVGSIGSYLNTNGTYTINSITIVFDKSKYYKTDKIVSHRGLNLPVYISKSGRAFVFAIHKRGHEYKKYIK